MGKTVFRRNKIIAGLFFRIHFGEKLGSGMERMREYCKKENEPFPKIEFTDNYFYIVFKPTKSYLKRVVGAKVGVKLTDREKGIGK